MIVANLDATCVSFIPNKADTPLPVDADTPLPRPVTGKRLKLVGRRNAQICKLLGAIDHPQLPSGNRLNLRRKPLAEKTVPDGFRFIVEEGFDYDNDNNAERYYRQTITSVSGTSSVKPWYAINMGSPSGSTRYRPNLREQGIWLSFTLRKTILISSQFRDLRAKAASDSDTHSDAQKLLGHKQSSTTAIYRRDKKDVVQPVMSKRRLDMDEKNKKTVIN